jgi:hypothetical protein
MSHAGTPRAVAAVVALAAVASLVSCSGDVLEQLAPKTAEVHVHFICGTAADSLGLNDGHGSSAWAIQRHQGEPIEWKAAPNVAINSITAKSGQFPFDTVQGEDHGGSPGVSYKAKAPAISGLPFTKKTFSYAISLTCNRGQPDSVRVVLDPEMIVRKP